MAGQLVNFSDVESRGVMKYLFLQGKSAKTIYDEMLQTMGDHAPCYATVKNWVVKFRTGHFGTEDETRPGRPP